MNKKAGTMFGIVFGCVILLAILILILKSFNIDVIGTLVGWTNMLLKR